MIPIICFPESLEESCKRLEHYETPAWAAQAILKKESLEGFVIDPCCGTGILAETAHRCGLPVHAIDIHFWGYRAQAAKQDYLETDSIYTKGEFDIFMNPPFSKAVQFVEKSLELGARKILCFQRFAWWESKSRRAFWEKYPPARVYICGDRANCWRHDIPVDKRGSSSPTAHAWFVWERGYIGDTSLGHIWKDAP